MENDLLTRVRSELDERLERLRPVVAEYERLTGHSLDTWPTP